MSQQRWAHSGHKQQGLSCVNDYITNISCVWHNLGQHADCYLHGNRSTFKGLVQRSCKLNHTAPSSRGCSIVYDMQFVFPEQIELEDPGYMQRTSRESQIQLDEIVELGKKYQARVRIRPVEPKSDDQIQGQWSDWSPVSTWQSTVGKQLDSPSVPDINQGFLPGAVVLVSVVGAISLVACVIYAHSRHLKRGQHVPDPSPYLQRCDDILRVEEVTVCSQEAFDPIAEALHPLQTYPTQGGGSSGQSSGFSNMGYFYSEYQPGSLCLDPCPVYFSYQPAGDSDILPTTSSYERLQGEPLSPDSGFGMEGAEVEEEEEESEEDVDMPVPSFPQCSQSPLSINQPLSFPQLPEHLQWSEGPLATPSRSHTPQPLEGAAVARPASMILQPCNSGYVTLKEMHNTYSNNSI
ncbi:interleukin-2 receptor subunit beta [Chanos chanos]|uniref:Interleukin-2 receptor subunit beta n=1 Tax=Chanos chanos TaxID=29144 RepID=A0A6J2WYH4_CHACN|nr:uncharacterized protein LOC115829297 [Chanos chanos]